MRKPWSTAAGVTRGNYENISVASWLSCHGICGPTSTPSTPLPIATDDLADETGSLAEKPAAAGRMAKNQLDRCYAGDAEHPVFVAAFGHHNSRVCDSQGALLRRLLTAFRQDQVVTRYDTPEDVLGYCQNSANLVGRLVLYLGHCHDAPPSRALRFDLYWPATGEFLSGCGPRLAERSGLFAQLHTCRAWLHIRDASRRSV